MTIRRSAALALASLLLSSAAAAQTGGTAGDAAMPPVPRERPAAAPDAAAQAPQARPPRAAQPQTAARPAREVFGATQMLQAQEALKTRGFDPGESDGRWGPRTAAALQQFQEAEGLTPTGTLNAETAEKLGVRPAPRPAQPQDQAARRPQAENEPPPKPRLPWAGRGELHSESAELTPSDDIRSSRPSTGIVPFAPYNAPPQTGISSGLQPGINQGGARVLGPEAIGRAPQSQAAAPPAPGTLPTGPSFGPAQPLGADRSPFTRFDPGYSSYPTDSLSRRGWQDQPIR